MKSLKKFGAVFLALAMCLSLCVTAFAEGNECSITIENSVNGKTYYAYQIFDATYDEESGAVSYTMSVTSAWKDLILSGDGQQYFVAQPVYEKGYDATSDPTGEHISYYAITKVADANDSEVTRWLQSCISVNEETGIATLTGGGTISPANTDGTSGTGSTVKIENLNAGYYFVSTTNGTTVSITTAAPDAEIIDKNQEPGYDLSKDILVHHGDDPDTTTKSEDEAMGDNVDFDITAYAPLYDGDKVVTEYIFTDTMSDGLVIELTSSMVSWGADVDGEMGYLLSADLINDWVKLTNSTGNDANFTDQVYAYSFRFTGVTDNGDGTYTAGGFVLKYYTYDKTNFDSDDPDNTFDTSKYPTDATIEIKYSAHITEDAVYDNTNDIDMEWKVTSWKTPTPDDPDDGEGKKDHDDVYTWELELVKIDGSTKIPLSGAEFTLYGTNLNEVKVSTEYTYVLKDNAEQDTEHTYESTEYYKLASGEFITTAPNDNMDPDVIYDDQPGPYLRYATTTTETAGATDKLVTGITDANGELTFAGLMSGNYVLTEITAPNGYNLLAEPISFTITWNEATGQFSMTDIQGTSTGASYNTLTGVFTWEIQNNAGTELPDTGGIGTTIFYIIGGVLVVGAVVVLVTRRRVNRES